MKALLAVAVLALAACGGEPNPTPTPTPPPVATPTPTAGPTAPASSPITHIIVVVQENRTQENMFHGYPDGKTFPGPADTVQTGLTSTDATVTLISQSLAASCGPSHSHSNFVTEYNAGAMNGFNLGNCKEPGGSVYAYAPASEVAADWFIAQNYGMANHVLQLNQGPSFPAHQQLIAGQAGGIDNATGGFTSDPWGFVENGGTKSGTGIGGHTQCGAPAGTTVTRIQLNSAFPGIEGSKAFPCWDGQTIFDLVAGAGKTWRYYGNKAGGLWSGPQAIKHLFNSPNYVVGGPNFFGDIAAGKLANLTYIMPNPPWSDHPSRHYPLATAGPAWVGDIVNAVGASPYWNSTAIVVTWDDWGGFYDHYKPTLGKATGTYGFRVPLIVASAYSKPGAVDAADTSQAAILRLIEGTFSIPEGALNTADAWTGDDLTTLFDFGSPPRAFVKVPTTEPASYFTSCKKCNDDSNLLDN